MDPEGRGERRRNGGASEGSRADDPGGWEGLRWPGPWAPAAALVVALATGFVSALILTTILARHPETELVANLGANLVTHAALVSASLALVAAANPGRNIIALAARFDPADWRLVLALVLFAPPAGLLLAAAATEFGLEMDETRMALLHHPIIMLAGVTLGPAAEEAWGRGLVYGALRRFGPGAALAGTTLVTAGIHWSAPQILATLPAMFGLTVIRHLTGRLAPSIVAHSAYNAVLMLLVVAGDPPG